MKRRWIFWVLIIAFIWVVVSRFTEIEGLAVILSQGKWEWVLVAAVTQVFYYIALSATYQAAFYTVEIQRRIRDLIPVTLGALFVNVAAPIGGAAGTALFVDDATRHGFSAGRAAAGALLQQISEFIAFTLALTIGLIYLFIKHDLKSYEIAGAALLFLIILTLCAVLLLGLFKPQLLHRLLRWAQNFANRVSQKVRKRPLVAENWAEKNAADFNEAAEAIRSHPDRLARTLGIALAAHIIDIASLYAVILAFYQPVSLGVLIAGYSIGILFWLVTITPQGIGVVEGVMALVFTSLDIPGGVAATISLAFRGLTFWLPLGLGFLLLRRVKSFGMGERSLAGTWTVRIVTILVVLMSLINLIAAVAPPRVSAFNPFPGPFSARIQISGYILTALSGFVLLVISGSLWRRKRPAWFFTEILLFLSVIAHIMRGFHVLPAVLAGIMAVWLLFLKYHFHVRSSAPSLRQGLNVLVISMVYWLVYGSIGFLRLGDQFDDVFNLWQALQQTILVLFNFSAAGLRPQSDFANYFIFSIYVVAAFVVGYAVVSIVRALIYRPPSTPSERQRASRIVERHGKTALSRLAILQDKSYHFSPGGSVIAYVARGRAAVALGDPIGPAQDLPQAVTSFKEYCKDNDLKPAFYQVLPDHLSLYHSAGFEALQIGNAGVIDLHEFAEQESSENTHGLLHSRFTSQGYKAVLYQPPLPESLVDDLHRISDEWLLTMHNSEKQFSIGWFDEAYIRSCPVMCVHIPNGTISAFANLIPEYERNEAAVDLLRHRFGAEEGTLDFLLFSLLLWAKAEGYATFNLGLSPLSTVGPEQDDPSPEKTLRFIEEQINRFSHFRELHLKKEKFNPEWSPRYLIYPDRISLPAITLTILRTNT